MAGWAHLRELVKEEFKQSIEEGRDASAVNALKAEFESAGTDEAKLRAVQEKILSIPIRKDFGFEEPSDLDGIRAARKGNTGKLAIQLSDEQLLDRLHGAWLGRCCGCALGKPVENFMGEHNGLTSMGRIKAYLQGVSSSEWPLSFYFPRSSPSEEQTGKVRCHPSTREEIAYMEQDDDINYTIIGQVVLREKGASFTTLDVAAAWIKHIPYRAICTAETQAYRNLVWRYWHHHYGKVDENEIDWNWVANNDNPYREWIGADIRIDSWGYACPGDPERAAEFAWRDARLSHTKNGIYGAMMFAAMIAAAFATDDPMAVVEAGLGQIPAKSRLHVEMRQVIEICRLEKFDPANFEGVLEKIYALLGAYHPVHTNNNAALVIAALLLGKKDFEKVITIAVMGGWDTDCTGATSGSIFGAMMGAKALPKKWTQPLNDTIRSSIQGYQPISIAECAKRSLEIVKGLRGG